MKSSKLKEIKKPKCIICGKQKGVVYLTTRGVYACANPPNSCALVAMHEFPKIEREFDFYFVKEKKNKIRF